MLKPSSILLIVLLGLTGCQAQNLFVAHRTVLGVNAAVNTEHSAGHLIIGYDRRFITVAPKSVDGDTDTDPAEKKDPPANSNKEAAKAAVLPKDGPAMPAVPVAKVDEGKPGATKPVTKAAAKTTGAAEAVKVTGSGTAKGRKEAMSVLSCSDFEVDGITLTKFTEQLATGKAARKLAKKMATKKGEGVDVIFDCWKKEKTAQKGG